MLKAQIEQVIKVFHILIDEKTIHIRLTQLAMLQAIKKFELFRKIKTIPMKKVLKNS